MLETRDLIWGLLLIGTAASLQVDIVPAQGEISVGESKFFLCTVTGEADLITWFSPSGDKIETGQRISVVRNDDLSSTLTVYSADIDDAGTYKCVATFDGNESQATVNMKIFQKLTFRNAPSPQEYNEGDDAVIICDVTSSPPPNVIWKHRSREIIHKKDVRFSVLSNNYLQIRGIKKSDEGTYRCEGRILARGEISFKDIQIIVNVPPAIRTRQTELNATSDIGQSVTLVCDADGFPEPAVSWARVKNVLEESDKYSFTEDGSQMTILNVKKEDQGEYTCIAKNKAGETEQEFSLNVFVKPKITYVENKTALELEEQITLTCEAIGDPTPSIVWSSASRIFTEGEQYTSNRIYQASWTRPEKYESLDGNVVVRSDGRVSSLTLKDIQYTDAGQYVCTARSSIGQDSQSMFLEVHYAPKLQGSVTVYTWEGNPANITCEVFAHPGASIVWFRDGQQLPNANTTNIKIYPTPTASFLEITPDSQSDFGNYNCTATNRIGQESKEFILIQAEVPSSPLINEVSPYSSTARVEFEEPDSSGGVPVLKYKAEWRIVGTSEWMRKEFDARNVYTENLITITGLRPDSRYELRMSAINGKGQGESSESTVFKTEPVHLLYTQYKLLTVLLLSYAPVSKSPLVEEIDFSLMNYNPPQANQFTKEFKAHQLKSAFMKGDRISFFGARRLFSANEEHENAQGGALVESEEDTQGDEQQSSSNLLEEDKEDLEQAVVTYVEELSSGADDIPVEPTEGDTTEVSSIPLIPTAPVDVVVATDLPTEPTEGETESAESEEEPLHPSAAGDPQGEAFSSAESLVLLHTEQTADELTTAEADVLPVVVTDEGTHVQEVTTVQMIEKEMDATEEATVETTGSEGAIEGTDILMQLDHVPESTEPGRGAGPLTERPPATEESPTEKPGVVQMGGLGTVPSEVVSELATGAPVESPAEHPTGMPVNLVLEEYTVGTALPTVETDGIVPVVYITEVTEDPVGGQVEKISMEAAAGEIESITAAQEEQSLQATKALASQELITGVTVSTTQLILEETGANVFKFIMTAEPTDSASGNPPETTVASVFTTQSATPVSGDPVEDSE
ncbi:neural cell adhesion molecule 1-like isoform X2 [Acipenser ruthenus]|uniref:neural cell adhesion molecule 1-like isoform X2 n=1 Tax=Acipenser ruthenus TaxID=7906 RepID=UPI00274104FA|nr:neural cell adhesion molecule 1-like isoform X2 [Acipenser ruthenus]